MLFLLCLRSGAPNLFSANSRSSSSTGLGVALHLLQTERARLWEGNYPCHTASKGQRGFQLGLSPPSLGSPGSRMPPFSPACCIMTHRIGDVVTRPSRPDQHLPGWALCGEGWLCHSSCPSAALNCNAASITSPKRLCLGES